MYTFEYALTREDYINFNVHFYKTSKTMQRSMWTARILLLVIAGVLPFVLTNPVNIVLILVTGALGIAVFIYYPKLIDRQMMKRIYKMLDEDNRGDLFASRTVVFKDELIEARTEHANTTYLWSGVINILEDADYIYMFVNRVTALILPKTLFKNEAEQIKFLSYCKTKTMQEQSQDL